VTSRDFCYWAQGFFEIADPKGLTAEQVECFKRHLALVFVHEIDPSMGDEKHQADLNAVHAPSKPAKPRPPGGGGHFGGGPLLRC
jgi:hypothetical protein